MKNIFHLSESKKKNTRPQLVDNCDVFRNITNQNPLRIAHHKSFSFK